MTDEEDDPFADLGETLDTTPATHDESAPPQGDEPGSSDSTQDSEPASTDTTGEQQNSSDEEPCEERDPLSEPAFPYEAAHQRPFYPATRPLGTLTRG